MGSLNIICCKNLDFIAHFHKKFFPLKPSRPNYCSYITKEFPHEMKLCFQAKGVIRFFVFFLLFLRLLHRSCRNLYRVNALLGQTVQMRIPCVVYLQ
uniref:Uncharacterized protein n=1 Tax=Anguilla anguilla TaxID=7936 RepID=A0A0E9W6A2_ANGAN